MVLVPLVKSQFFNMRRVEGDIRQLELWVRWADLQKEPQEVFSFLWSRGIGTEHALLFESWVSQRGAPLEAVLLLRL